MLDWENLVESACQTVTRRNFESQISSREVAQNRKASIGIAHNSKRRHSEWRLVFKLLLCVHIGCIVFVFNPPHFSAQFVCKQEVSSLKHCLYSEELYAQYTTLRATYHYRKWTLSNGQCSRTAVKTNGRTKNTSGNDETTKTDQVAIAKSMLFLNVGQPGKTKRGQLENSRTVQTLNFKLWTSKLSDGRRRDPKPNSRKRKNQINIF